MARRRQRLLKDPIELQVDSLSHDGRGIAQLDGKKIFIDGALPGETVACLYTRKKKSYDEAKVETIIKASPDRIEADCEYFGVCGGCSLQHLSQQSQIEHKQSVLLDHYNHYAKIDVRDPLPPILGPAWGYRRKARLGVKNVPKKGGILIGFREKHQANLITDMQSCKVLHPSIGDLLPSLREMLSQLSIPSAIPQLEFAVGDTAAAVIIRHLEAFTEQDLEILSDYAQQHALQIYGQSAGPATIKRLFPKEETTLEYAVVNPNVSLTFHPSDFTQVNAEINQKMLQRTLEMLEPTADDRILDLFCGLGNFSLPIAHFAKAVVGVEGDAKMVERAKHNAKRNQLTNVDFYTADLSKDLSTQAWAKEQFTKIVIDPPRTGAQEVIAHFPQLAAQRIVYISCDPATIARDAALLLAQGYRLKQTGVMDMFPQTSHVESIACFDKV